MLPKKERDPGNNSQVQPSPSPPTNPAFPFGSYPPAPWDQYRRQVMDRESKPTHPILVYHSAYSLGGKVKGWKQRRNYEETEKFQVQEMSLGVLWSW